MSSGQHGQEGGESRDRFLEVSHLCKTFTSSGGQLVQALDDVSFSVGSGEFISIVAPSGGGKTTLLRILAGLTSYESGRVVIGGEVMDARPRPDVGVVFQQPGLLPWKNVVENAALPLRLLGRSNDAYTRAEALLDMVGLKPFMRAFPRELSGGMQQRLAIVRALIRDPAVLLMDEPFGALDALTREYLNVELNRIWRETEKTVILITHSIQEAVFLSTRVLVMSRQPGRLLADHSLPWPAERGPELLGSREFGLHAGVVRQFLEQEGHR